MARPIPASVRSTARDCYRLFVTRAIDSCYGCGGQLFAYMSEDCQSVTVDGPDGHYWVVPAAASWMEF